MGRSTNSLSMAILWGMAVLCACWLPWTLNAIGINWGTQLTHPLPAETVVQLLIDNGIQKVKLFDANNDALRALGKTNIEVMVGIPNDLLSDLARSLKAAEKWVHDNVSDHISSGAKIRYVAVGNEPFLKTYNGSYLDSTYPALRNILSALIKAGLASRVKVTVPLNADVYSSNGLPSTGDFRADIHDRVMNIVKLLSDNGGSFTVNIYPFLSLYTDPNFPVDYAFFDSSTQTLTDGGVTYSNMFDANYDTLAWALQKNGFKDLPIIVGEIGWPTDGDQYANTAFAQRFNQGFVVHLAKANGTPMRPGHIEAYLFSMIDEDAKSIEPGNFERHWGIFFYDGQVKYALNLGTTPSPTLVSARNVRYLERKWCALKPSANLQDPLVALAVSYACGKADCTSLGYRTSCGNLDAQGNISYAFNSYYQIYNQPNEACDFKGLATITQTNLSTGACRFPIMIEPEVSGVKPRPGYAQKWSTCLVPGLVLCLLAVL